MRKMINLVRNENMKLSHSISTWIMMGILVLIIVAMGLLFKFGGGVAAPTSGDWKADVKIQNESLKKSIAEPGVPKMIKAPIEKEIQNNEYRLKNDIEPIQTNSLWGFVEGASSMISLIALFAIVMGGGIVANEF